MASANHTLVTRWLLREGFFSNGVIEERQLQSEPLDIGAHLAVMDALIEAYISKRLNANKIIHCLKRHANVHDNEMPNDLDGALLLWVNKICCRVRKSLDATVVKDAQLFIPEVDDLYEDIYDGICIATVLHFYSRGKLDLQDISFNDPATWDDSLHNWTLIQHFCLQLLPVKIFHFDSIDSLLLNRGAASNFSEENPEIVSQNLDSLIRLFLVELFLNLEKDYLESCNINHQPSLNRYSLTNGSHARNETEMNFVLPQPSPNRPDDIPNLRQFISVSNQQTVKSPTGYFSPSSANPALAHLINAEAAYQRSDSLPSSSGVLLNPVNSSPSKNGAADYVNETSATTRTTPSAALRLMLDEKRRQIENRKSLDALNKAHVSDNASKEAFFRLHDKKLNGDTPGKAMDRKSSLTSKLREKQQKEQQQQKQQATSPVSLSDPQRRSVSPSGPSHPFTDRPFGEYADVSRSLSELKEQMKRLSIDHQKLQEQVLASQQQPAAPARFSTGSRPKSSFETSYSVDFASSVAEPQAAAPTMGPFHLHTPTEPPSRLDPSLELSRDLSCWGMTLKSSGRTPRKTWGAEQVASPVASSPFDHAGPSSKMSESLMSTPTTGSDSFCLFENSPQKSKSSSSVQQIASNLHEDYDNIPTLRMGQSNRQTSAPPVQEEQQNNFSPIRVSPLVSAPKITTSPAVSLILKSKLATPQSSSAIGFVIGGENDQRHEESLDERKNRFIAAALKRKEDQELRRTELEHAKLIKQDQLAKKQEEEELRKREKEIRRLKAFEDYQRRKIEHEQAEFASRNQMPFLRESLGSTTTVNNNSSGTVPRPQPRSANRVRSHTAGVRNRLARPASQYVTNNASGGGSAAVGTSNTHGSVDNLDLNDGKSQSSDGAASGSWCLAEPTLKVFVKPTQKSNRNLVLNAIRDRVLVGAANNEKKTKVLEELARSDGKHFLILFRDQKCQFRAVYSWDQQSDNVHKIYGAGPKVCSEKSIKLLFKYDSGAKNFLQVPARHLSATIDAFTVTEDYWQEKRLPYGKSMTMVN